MSQNNLFSAVLYTVNFFLFFYNDAYLVANHIFDEYINACMNEYTFLNIIQDGFSYFSDVL